MTINDFIFFLPQVVHSHAPSYRHAMSDDEANPAPFDPFWDLRLLRENRPLLRETRPQFAYYRNYRLMWRVLTFGARTGRRPFQAINNGNQPIKQVHKVYVVRFLRSDSLMPDPRSRDFAEIPWRILKQVPGNRVEDATGTPLWRRWPPLVHQKENVPPIRTRRSRNSQDQPPEPRTRNN